MKFKLRNLNSLFFLKRITEPLRNYCSSSKIIEKRIEDVLRGSKSMGNFGQPTHDSHPHLLNEGEITPLITKGEYQMRREKLIQEIRKVHALTVTKNEKAHLVIVSSASRQFMSDKIPYVFRQNSDFLYLTGCKEPDTCLVLETYNNLSKYCATIFMRDKDSHSEMWDGPRTSPEDAAEYFGVDQGLPMSELERYIRSYLKANKSSTIWYEHMNPLQLTIHRTLLPFIADNVYTFERPVPIIHKLRLIKSEAEIKLLQKACEITCEAFKETMRYTKSDRTEHQLNATVDYESRIRGADFLAYPPVIAGGNRANTIHYIRNDQMLVDGDLVLMDAGCEYNGYCSDVTRTWPVSGSFTREQRALYEAVLYAQEDIIKKCMECPSLDKLLDEMYILLGRQLQELGLISKSARNYDVYKLVQQFCPHHVSHYLGMDVHDTSSVSRNMRLQPGMVLTVEPGIYIDAKNELVQEEFRGIGIRIEDDVLITENGPVVLSKNCPKSVKKVEKAVKEK